MAILRIDMKPREINYSEAYSSVSQVIKAIKNPESMQLNIETLGDFLEFREPDFYDQIAKPQKRTLLHNFIYNINNFDVQYYLRKIDAENIILEFGPLLDGANLTRPSWFNTSEIDEHIDDLSKILNRASDIITDASFLLLFADRTFLFEFNKFVSNYIQELEPSEHSCLNNDSIVKRVYFPVWLKNAIFHRDKGRCQLCSCDLTNLLVPTENRHLDHMVPLKAGGTNDPTNFQLTCESCNTSKGAKVLANNHLSFPWW